MSEPVNQNDPIGQRINDGSFSPRQGLIVLICMLLNLSDGFDVMSWAYTADRVSRDLILSPDQIGMVASAALAGMMLGAMFLAPLSDLYGRRKLIMVSVLVIALAMLATAFVSSLLVLLLLRLVAGLGVGAILASLAAIASEYSPEKYKSLVVVSITLGYPIGAMLAGLIAAQVLPVYDWPAMYLGGALANVVLLVLVWLYIPESLYYLARKRPDNALHQMNQILLSIDRPGFSSLPETPDAEHRSGTLRHNVQALLSPRWRSQTLLLWLAFFMCFICLYFLMSWIPKLLIDAGFKEQQSLMGGTIFNFGSFFGVIVVGLLAMRFTLTTVVGIFLMLSSVLMVVYAFSPSDISLLLALIFMIGILQQGGFTGLYAVAAKIYPADIKATGIGWSIGLGRFGAVAGPYLAGVLILGGASMESLFIVFAVPMIIGGLITWKLGIR